MLSGAGFKQVASMEGGINAWKGLVAEGPPESGMAYFSPAATAEELIALAWLLEDGSRKFYSELTGRLTDPEAGNLFKDLTAAEERHQASLLELYREFSPDHPVKEFPGSVIPPGDEGDTMEGGVSLRETLEWAKGKNLMDILELSISLETNAYDLYIKMKRNTGDRRSIRVFDHLMEEEKQHLKSLSSILEKKI